MLFRVLKFIIPQREETGGIWISLPNPGTVELWDTS